MIAIIRTSDRAVMNDRQSSDWPEYQKLEALRTQRADAPPNTDLLVLERLGQAIIALEAERDAWQTRRKAACVKMFGGAIDGYDCVQIPKESEAAFLAARYIEEIDGVLLYQNIPEYVVDGSTIIVSPGWVKGNYRLLDEDVTDFSGLTLTEPLYFRLVYVQSQATEAISVKLFTRLEDEEFGGIPGNLTWLRIICEGRINMDHTITVGGN